MESDAVKALEKAFEDVTIFKEDDLLLYCLPVFGYTLKRQASVQRKENVLRFKEHFGVEPPTVSAVLADLKKEYPDKFRAKDALMTLYWLKCYGTERTVAGPWKVGCLSGLRTTVKQVSADIGYLKKYKIVFGNFEEGDIYPYLVDGMNVETSECFCCLTLFASGNPLIPSLLFFFRRIQAQPEFKVVQSQKP